ncbi:lectin [Apostichopus japonicus]|uniref:Lectin n=1 Tax=Stichopus japonicus TaxID=307972 RepID=A0A2G8KVL7_STIJA|nr:lectin [Apostichopus japonicus]
MIRKGGLATIFLIICGLGQLCDAQVEAQCPPHWTFWRRHCYRFINNPRLSWLSAEQYCNRLVPGELPHLVSIDSELENTIVRALVDNLREPSSARRHSWMGYNEIVRERNWVWSDQSRSYYSKWERGQPNNSGVDQDCGGLINSGAWDDLVCSLRLPFTCKM